MTETTTESDSAVDLRNPPTARHFTRWIDILPLRAGRRGAIEWFPATDDYSPQAGFVRVTMHDDTTTYAVTEFPRSVGRGFMLSKVGGKGTDKRRGGYAVECVEGAAVSCECESRVGHCKHRDSVQTLLMNGWL